MDKREFPWGRLAAAGVIALVLNLIGVLWLGLSQERLRAAMAVLDQEVRALPPAAPCGDVEAMEAEIAGLRQAVTGLSGKLEGLKPSREDAKALDRLAGEVKALAARVEALGAAKTAKPAKSEKTASPPRERPAPGGPYYGPGYPGWPGY